MTNVFRGASGGAKAPAGPSTTRRSVARAVLMTGLLVGLVLVGLVSVNACSVTVQSGEAGIKSTKFGANPGVQLSALSPGWHWEGFGEKIRTYPTRQITHTFGRGDKLNDEINFADVNGIPLSADVNTTLQVRFSNAPGLYASWRQEFDDLLDGQIRNDVRAAVSSESEKMNVSDLYSGGRQAMLQRALVKVQAKWAVQGVDIKSMEWTGPLRYPDTVTAAIEQATQASQATRAALQKVELAKANAQAQVETARGEAEANRLKAESARANPELIPLLYAQAFANKWDGVLPQVQGAGTPLINLPGKAK